MPKQVYITGMDVQTLSTVMSQDNIEQQASAEMLKKSMDMTKTEGEDVVQMIEKSAPAPLPADTGNLVDLFA
jgi:hypothetical protein